MGKKRREEFHCGSCGRRLFSDKYSLCDECYSQLIKNNLKKEEKPIVEEKIIRKNKPPRLVDKKNKNKVMIEFIGESHNGVVGSSIICSYPTKEGAYEHILIELGMVQKNGALKEEYAINKEVVDRVLDYGDFKAVFISHAHLSITQGLLLA